MTGVKRRTVVAGAAWATPAVIALSPVPAFAASKCTASPQVSFNGTVNMMGGGGSCQPMGSNWSWRSSPGTQFRTGDKTIAELLYSTSAFNSVPAVGSAPAAGCPAYAAGPYNSYIDAIANPYSTNDRRPSNCTLAPQQPSFATNFVEPYLVFMGDMLAPPAGGGATMMAIHTANVAWCNTCTYTFSFDWWASSLFSKDIQLQFGWATTFPSSANPTLPATWLAGPTTISSTAGASPTSGSTSVSWTPSGAAGGTTLAYLVVKVTVKNLNATNYSDYVASGTYDPNACAAALNDIAITKLRLARTGC